MGGLAHPSTQYLPDQDILTYYCEVHLIIFYVWYSDESDFHKIGL